MPIICTAVTKDRKQNAPIGERTAYMNFVTTVFSE